MKTRIAWVSILAGDPKDPALKAYEEFAMKNADLAKNDDTEITFINLKSGLTTLEEYFWSYLTFRNDREFYEAIIQAEKDGYDAVLLGCYYDPCRKVARQAVDIPVIGPAQSTSLFATMMGWKFGTISISPEACLEMEEDIERMGLKDKAVRVRPLPCSALEQMESCVNAKLDIEAFKKVARESIADGAEVLIPGCLLMAPAMRLAPGCEKEYPNGLQEVDGVPVLDVISIMVKTAEVMVSLKRAGSAWISRKGMYRRASKEVEQAAISKFPYLGSGTWKRLGKGGR